MFSSSTNTASSFGGFGNNSTASNTGGTLFGSKPATQSGGGLFGNTPNNTSGNTTSGGLFSSNQNKSSAIGTGNSLFGSSGTSNQNSTGGLAGNTSNNNTSAGLFSSNTSNNLSNSGGLFGGANKAPTTTSGGLFGGSNNNNNNNNNNNTSGGLFGGNINTSGAGSGLFGNKPSNISTGGGLFGNTANNNATTGSLFGSSNNTNSNTGLFSGPNISVQQVQQNQQLTSMTRVGDLPPDMKRELEEFDKYINSQHLIATTLQADLEKHDELIQSIPKDIYYLHNKLLSTKQALKFDSNQLQNLKSLNNELTEDINKIMQLILQLSTPGTKLSSGLQLNEFFVRKIKKYHEVLNYYESIVDEANTILNGLERTCNEGFGSFFNIIEVMKSQYILFMELCENMAQLHNEINKLNK